MKKSYLSTMMLAAISMMTSVSAQENQDQIKVDDGKIEKIQVTATKRVESVQEVGISMSAFNDTDLQEMNVGESVDLAAQVPNVQVNFGFGQNSFNIRGIGTNEFAANLDGPVATHIDEIYQSKSFMTTLGIFDIARVEVLKGPQGTVFGRNTTGGSVNFVTNKPTEDFEAGVNYSYGNYNTHKAEGFISSGLSDNLSGRLAGYVNNQSDGYYDNTINGVTSDVGKQDEIALRGMLSWEWDEASLLLSAHYGEDNSELSPYQALGIVNPTTGELCAEYADGSVTGTTPECVRPTAGGINEDDNDPFTSTQNAYPLNNNTTSGISAHLNFDTGLGEVTSISAYEYFERDYREDADNSTIRSVDVYYYNEIEQFTQEIRLAGEAEDFSYLAGFFYEHDSFTNVNALDSADFLGFIANTDFKQQVDASALFLHTQYYINDDLELIAGLRYTHEKTKFEGGTFYGSTDFGPDPKIQRSADYLFPLSHSDAIEGGNERTDKDLSYKLGLDWKADEDTLVYASVSTGFRSGGFNGGFPFTQAELTSFEPEEMTAYEIGFKTTLADDTLQLNGSTFYYDYKDLQVNVDAPNSPAPITTNATDSRSVGAEIDLYYKPSAEWDIKFGLGYLDAEFSSDFIVNGVNRKGNRPANSPKYTANTMIRYETPITDGLVIRASTNLSWRDEQYFEAENKPSNLQDAYMVADARITLFPQDGDWEVSLWGKNLFDKEYLTYVNDLPAFGFILNIYGQPTTYGISFKYNWY